VSSDALAESVRLGRIALDVARQSAAYLRAAFRAPMEVADKGSPHDVVTEHDLASEAIIRKGILDREPDSHIRGEEGGSVGTGQYVWHVDPIDGTVNFASGIAFWCISIAVAMNEEVVAGVIVDPMSRHEFTVDGTGFHVDGAVPPRRPVAPHESRATLVNTFPRSLDLEDDADLALATTAELLRAFGASRAMGSGALGLAHVAAGWADATFDLHTNPWDVAAGQLMVRASGGRFVGYERGEADEDPRTAYTRPGYWAAGAGADYPTLDRLVRTLSTKSTT
jgi:myo-inositol-1(or 4)-monophosphatase